MENNIPKVKVSYILNGESLINGFHELNKAEIESIKMAGVIKSELDFYEIESFCFDITDDKNVLIVYLKK